MLFSRNLWTGVGALALAAGAAQGATSSGTFPVNATVISSCNVSGTLLNFGAALDPLAAAVPVDASSTLTVTCTNTTPYTVALDAGTHAGSSSFAGRSMKNGSYSMGYQLYVNSGRSTVWGDGTGGSSTASGVGTGSAQSITVYGRVPSLTGAVPGTYTDTITVTVTY